MFYSNQLGSDCPSNGNANTSHCNSTESLIKHAKMHTALQHGEALAFASAVHEETCWFVCIMAIETLQIIFTDVSQQSE